MSEPDSHRAHKWQLGIAAGTGAIIAAPYVMTALGSKTSMHLAMASLHGHGLAAGSGLAGFINGGLSHIPLVGNAIATTSTTATGLAAYSGLIATAGIGIGGVLLANYLEKREKNDPPGAIKWSKIIRYGSLATSMLIALPSILTGVSVGISFIALSICSAAVAGQVFTFMASTLGSVGAHVGGGSLFAATFPHLLTCGASLLPAAGALFLGKSHDAEPTKEKPPENWAARVQNTPPAAAALGA